MVLRAPVVEDEAALGRLHEQLAEEDFEFLLAEGTWDEILAEFHRSATGVGLPEGWVRSDFLVAEVGHALVGRVSIRHSLTPRLLEVGGHIGYAVGPEFRCRGYATQILRLSLARLAELGVERALVTCEAENIGSVRTIEACGGVLEDVRSHQGRRTRRYWFCTRPITGRPTAPA